MAVNRSILTALAAMALLVGSCVPNTTPSPTPAPPVPDPPEDPDPITAVSEPGAYGMEGGTVMFDLTQIQLSRLEYKDGMSLRILSPETITVTSISGLPREFKTGSTVSFLYRIQKGGHSVLAKRYEMKVIQVNEDMVWLKQNDETYLVLQL